ncbi:MAG: DUF4190 domain-containing protein [Victivallales bacterium]|nr:DUF4190 domain-containing protein [Victivallales bacterium]
MGVFVFNCPHCGKQIGAQDEWEGKTTMCPHCQKPVVIRHEMPNPPGGMAQPMMSTWGDYEAGPPEVSKNAKNAMWFGIASVCCCQICSVVALVLGIMGLSEIKKSNGRLEGKSYAWIGIGLAILPWIMWIIQMIFAPQMAETYMQLLDKYMGTNRTHIEQYEEEMEDIPIKPLPEPKSEPESEPNAEPKEREEPSVPIKTPNDGNTNPETLI